MVSLIALGRKFCDFNGKFPARVLNENNNLLIAKLSGQPDVLTGTHWANKAR